jgi:hypothetical protein
VTADRAIFGADKKAIRSAVAAPSLIKWVNQPFSYDPNTVWNGDGVPLHPAAARLWGGSIPSNEVPVFDRVSSTSRDPLSRPWLWC